MMKQISLFCEEKQVKKNDKVNQFRYNHKHYQLFKYQLDVTTVLGTHVKYLIIFGRET